MLFLVVSYSLNALCGTSAKKRIKILNQSHAQRKDITLMDGDVVQMRVCWKRLSTRDEKIYLFLMFIKIKK